MLKKQKPTFNPARFDSKSFKSLTESIQNIQEQSPGSTSAKGSTSPRGGSSGGPMNTGFGPKSTPKVTKRGRTQPRVTTPNYYGLNLGKNILTSIGGRALENFDDARGVSTSLLGAALTAALATAPGLVLPSILGPLGMGVGTRNPTLNPQTPNAPAGAKPRTFPKPF